MSGFDYAKQQEVQTKRDEQIHANRVAEFTKTPTASLKTTDPSPPVTIQGMSGRETVSACIHFETDGPDSSLGYEIAQQVLFAMADGGSKKDAAKEFIEALMAVAVNDSAGVLAATLHGVVSLLIDVTGKAEVAVTA